MNEEPEQWMAGSTVMTKAGPLSLSFSQLGAYGRCPKSYELRWLQQADGITLGSGLAGSAFHTTVELSEQLSWWRLPPVRAVPRLQQAWAVDFGLRMQQAMDRNLGIRWTGRAQIVVDENGENVQARDETGALVWKEARNGRRYPVWAKARENLAWWCFHSKTFFQRYLTIRNDMEAAGMRVAPGDVERSFGVHIPMPCKVCNGSGRATVFREDHWDPCSTCDGGGEVPQLITGKVDILVLEDHATGEYVIADWKTGTYIDPFQLAVYAWLLYRITGIEVTRGVVLYLRGKEHGDWWKEFDLTKLIPLVEQRFQDLARGIAAKVFPIAPSGLCPSCTVRTACPYGRTLEVDFEEIA